MILKNNGQVIVDPYPLEARTEEYLKRFWKLPNRQKYQEERENILITDKIGGH